jgi:hypothetical protein
VIGRPCPRWIALLDERLCHNTAGLITATWLAGPEARLEAGRDEGRRAAGGTAQFAAAAARVPADAHEPDRELGWPDSAMLRAA